MTLPRVNEDPNEVRNTAILIVGCTGSGKSTLGNWLLDDDLFVTDSKMDHVTERCQSIPIQIDGREFVLIDTPGVFDATINNAEHLSRIEALINLCSYGIQAIILVINIDDYHNFEKTIRLIKKFLGDGVINHILVAFSHVNRAKSVEHQIETKLNPSMKKFLRTIENRWFITPNPDSFERDHQVVKRNMDNAKEMILKFRNAYNLSNFRNARSHNYWSSKLYVFLNFFLVLFCFFIYSRFNHVSGSNEHKNYQHRHYV